ncbi:MAG: hypothetical protein M1840_003246 [Geoglossum simile]|nr:MAG: hypothetical protein M1840_003246 [Geoglossum simile]
MNIRSGVSGGLCVFCGFCVASPGESRPPFWAEDADLNWLGEFRALRDRYEDSDGEAFLTGIGVSQRQRLDEPCAPSDRRVRYDDPGYQESRRDRFRTRTRLPRPRRNEKLGIGYQIHASCWELFRHWHFRRIGRDPGGPDLKCLFAVLQSTLWGHGGGDWGGTYGGLFDRKTGINYTRLFPKDFSNVTRLTNKGSFDFASIPEAVADPIGIPEIEEIMAGVEPGLTKVMDIELLFGSRPEKRSQASCEALDSLPDVPLHMVFEYLHVRDMRNLWFATRCVPDSLPQSFWKSRFTPELDLGFVYETDEKWSVSGLDWRTIYAKVKALLSAPRARSRIRNRRRILGILEKVVGLLPLYAEKEPEGDFVEPQRLDLLSPGPRIGAQASMLSSDGFQMHWRRFGWPDKIEALTVSRISLGSKKYISGFRVSPLPVGMGYFHDSLSTEINLPQGTHDRIRYIGFHLDQLGIRGIYLVTDDNRTIGIIDVPDRTGLSSQGVLPARGDLIGTFDALRLTSVGSSTSTDIPFCWRPCQPPDDIALDASKLYSGLRPVVTWNMAYSPLCYCLFGGESSRGECQLTRIKGFAIKGERVVGIELTHATGERQQMGSQNGSEIVFDISHGEYVNEVRISPPPVPVLGPRITVRLSFPQTTNLCGQ